MKLLREMTVLGAGAVAGYLVDQAAGYVAKPAAVVDAAFSALAGLPSVPTEIKDSSDALNNSDERGTEPQSLAAMHNSADTVLASQASVDPPGKGEGDTSEPTVLTMSFPAETTVKLQVKQGPDGPAVPGSEQILPFRDERSPSNGGSPEETINGILRKAEALHMAFHGLYRWHGQRIDSWSGRADARRLLETATRSLGGLAQAIDLLSDPRLGVSSQSSRLYMQLLDLQSSANVCIIAVCELLQEADRMATIVQGDMATQTETRKSLMKRVFSCFFAEELDFSGCHERRTAPRPSRLNPLIGRFLASLHRLLDVLEETRADDLPPPPNLGAKLQTMRKSLNNLYPSLPLIDVTIQQNTKPKPSAPTASMLGSLLRLGSVWGKAQSRVIV